MRLWLNHRYSIEAAGDPCDSLYIWNGQPAMVIRLEAGADAALREEIWPARGRESHMKEARDVFDAHHVDVTPIPRREMPSSVGKPKQRGGELPRVAQREPNKLLPGEGDGRPAQ